MARSKGVSERAVLFKHALRPSLFSFLTVFGITTGALIGGSLIVETIFRVPGPRVGDRRSRRRRGLPDRARDRDDHRVRLRGREHPRRRRCTRSSIRGSGDERASSTWAAANSMAINAAVTADDSTPEAEVTQAQRSGGPSGCALGWLVLIVAPRSWRRGCRSRTRTPTSSTATSVGRRMPPNSARSGSVPTRTLATCSRGRSTVPECRWSSGSSAIASGMIIGGTLGIDRRVLPRLLRPGHLVRLPRAAVVPGPGARDPDHVAARPRPRSRSRRHSDSWRSRPSVASPGPPRSSTRARVRVAARTLGARHPRIIIRELLPNVVIPMGALALLGMAVAIVAEGGLAFLGLSVEKEETWGKLILLGSGVARPREGPVDLDGSRFSCCSSPCLRSTSPATRCAPTSTCKEISPVNDAPPDRGTRRRGHVARGRPISRPTSAPNAAWCVPSTASPSNLERGKALGIVGESGSGKTVLSRTIMGLLPVDRSAVRARSSSPGRRRSG